MVYRSIKQASICAIIIIALIAAAGAYNCQTEGEITICTFGHTLQKITQDQEEQIQIEQELNQMKTEFSKEFADVIDIATDDDLEEIKSQIQDYLSCVRQEKQVQIILEDEQVSELINGKLTIEELFKVE